jgi:Big-like domain-containing protein
MSPRRTVGTFLALAVAGLGLAVTPAVVPAAQAVTGSPPVTTPDSGTVFQGGFTELQPVNNDHDPDNDQLAICRLGTEHYGGLQALFVENDWAVFAKRRAKPGTYTFTYYACDFSYLTPGTITITVEALPKITVKKIASNPGHLRVTNPSDFKVRFLWGSFKEDRPDGRLIIDKDSAVVIAVSRTRIDWVASDRKGELFFVSGHVSGIKLARGAPRPLGQVALPPRLAELWRTA